MKQDELTPEDRDFLDRWRPRVSRALAIPPDLVTVEIVDDWLDAQEGA